MSVGGIIRAKPKFHSQKAFSKRFERTNTNPEATLNESRGIRITPTGGTVGNRPAGRRFLSAVWIVPLWQNPVRTESR